MGYNSGLIILNDSLHVIKENPLQFTEGVVQAIQGAGGRLRDGQYVDIGVQNHVNAASLFHMAHADEHRAVLIGGNCIRPLPGKTQFYGGYIKPETVNEDVLRDMADTMGFRLVKKAKKN